MKNVPNSRLCYSMPASLAIATMFVGCSANAPKVTQVPFLDRVMTVLEFTAAPDMRKKVSDFCRNDPGRTMLDPNCMNAQQSLHLSYAGAGNFPKIDISSPHK